MAILLCFVCYTRFLQANRNARLVIAVKSLNLALARAALQEGADPNARMQVELKPTFRDFLLDAWSHFVNAEHKQNASQPKTALVWALKVQSEHDPPDVQEIQQGGPVALLLIAQGANVNVKSEETPVLFFAVGDELPDVVAAMIDHGANLRSTDGEANTALMYAVSDDSIGILQILLAHGVPVNAQNKEGKTALMEAARRQQLHALKLLLKAGADVTIKDQQGDTALKIARTSNAPDAVINNLKSAGAKD